MSGLSQEDIDRKIAEAIAEAGELSRRTKRKAGSLDIASDDEMDCESVTSEDIVGNYDNYEIEFIEDEYTPSNKNKKNNKKKPAAGKKAKKCTVTSTETSTTATVTASTANKTMPATTAAPKKGKCLKKDVELPIKIDLIELVKKERCLYNLKGPMYMSRVHKQMIWEKISTSLKEYYEDMNVEKCKKMWMAVRESTR